MEDKFIITQGKKTGVVIPNFYRIYETLVDPVYVKVSTEINNSIISIASIEQALVEKSWKHFGFQILIL